VDFEVTVARAAQRDTQLFGGPEALRRRYMTRYVPGQQLYLARVQPERLAPVVVNNNDPLHATIDESSASDTGAAATGS
jgi:uridine kinase